MVRDGPLRPSCGLGADCPAPSSPGFVVLPRPTLGPPRHRPLRHLQPGANSPGAHPGRSRLGACRRRCAGSRFLGSRPSASPTTPCGRSATGASSGSAEGTRRRILARFEPVVDPVGLIHCGASALPSSAGSRRPRRHPTWAPCAARRGSPLSAGATRPRRPAHPRAAGGRRATALGRSSACGTSRALGVRGLAGPSDDYSLSDNQAVEGGITPAHRHAEREQLGLVLIEVVRACLSPQREAPGTAHHSRRGEEVPRGRLWPDLAALRLTPQALVHQGGETL